MGCVTDTITIALRISPLEDGVIASKYSVHSTLVVVQRSRSGDPVRDVRCDRRHLETQKNIWVWLVVNTQSLTAAHAH